MGNEWEAAVGNEYIVEKDEEISNDKNEHEKT